MSSQQNPATTIRQWTPILDALQIPSCTAADGYCLQAATSSPAAVSTAIRPAMWLRLFTSPRITSISHVPAKVRQSRVKLLPNKSDKSAVSNPNEKSPGRRFLPLHKPLFFAKKRPLGSKESVLKKAQGKIDDFR